LRMQHPTSPMYLGSKPVDMKSLLLCFCLFAFFTSAAQKAHELKADVLMPFFKGAHLSYEYVPNGKLGIEFEARYRWGVDGAYRISPPNATNPLIDYYVTFIDAPQQVLTLTLAGKYYFVSGNGRGVFTGGYMRNDILVTREIDLYEELTIPEYDYYTLEKRRLRVGVGALAGYKFLIKQHLAVEVGIGADVRLNEMQTYVDSGFPIACILTLKAGYRF